MKRVSRSRPITGAKPQMRFTPSVRTTSNTSADAERLVSQPPMPFQSRRGVLAPVGVHPQFRAASNFARDYMHPAKPAKFDASAVGYPSKGYFSEAGRNSINNGFPVSAPRKVGRISLSKGVQASSKETDRIRKNYPGLGIGKWRP